MDCIKSPVFLFLRKNKKEDSLPNGFVIIMIIKIASRPVRIYELKREKLVESCIESFLS